MLQLIRNEEAVSQSEIRKTNIIKTLYYLLLIYRTYQILNCYFYYQGALLLEELLFSGMYCILIFLMLFRNYWIIPLLIALLQAKFDAYFNCHTVGSNITVFINLYFAAFYFSLKKLNSSQNKNYTEFNLSFNNYKYLIAILWGTLNLFSLIHHLKDPYWLNGSAFGVMLCNPFLSPFFKTFREFYLSQPETYNIISNIFSHAFIIMQILMLPLFFIRKTRFVFYLFMLSYCIGITFFIDTSFLAHFAWLLFCLLLPQFAIINKKIHIEKNALRLSKILPKLNKSFATVMLIFILFNTPKLDEAVKKVIWFFREWDTYRYVDRKLGMLGLGKANLFNSYQIEGNGKWFVIYKKEKSDWKLVPIMDTTGRKLSYNRDLLHTVNHGSDFLWLANTFCYAIGQDRVDYSNSSTPYKMPGPVYERLVRFDFNKYAENSLTEYRINFYSNLKFKNTANPFLVAKDSMLYYSCTAKKIIKTEKLIILQPISNSR